MSAARAVLVIAASDSSGGAGLTRDVETLTHFATPVRCALTAVTVQTDAQVRAVQALPAELIAAQIRAALDTGAIGAIKIGMLGSAAAVQAVAGCLPSRRLLPIVLDPVLMSSSGGALLEPAALADLRRLLLPHVTLLTPNLPEAAALLDAPPARDSADCRAQVHALLALGPGAVLLKGGHSAAAGSGRSGDTASDGAEQVVDWLGVQQGEIVPIVGRRIAAQRRGTGCSAASAIAAQLAAGVPLAQACRSAQDYLIRALEAAQRGGAEPPSTPAA